MRKRKVPASVERIATALKSGKRLCRAFRKKETGENEVCYFYEPGGVRCGRRTAEKALRMGVIKPVGDGLFAEDSQTFDLA